MSAETKKGINLISALSRVFSTEADCDDSVYEFNPELEEGLENSDKMMEESAEPLNVSGGKSNKKGGFGNKINPKTEEATRKYYQELNDNEKYEKDKNDDGIQL